MSLNQYRYDILRCYEMSWECNKCVPTIDDVLEIYRSSVNEDAIMFAIDMYKEDDSSSDIRRVFENGLSDSDYVAIGFDEDSCRHDIDVILETEGLTFYRNEKEIVNSPVMGLFLVRR